MSRVLRPNTWSSTIGQGDHGDSFRITRITLLTHSMVKSALFDVRAWAYPPWWDNVWADGFHFLQVEASFVLYGLLYGSAWAHSRPLSARFAGVAPGFLVPQADSSQAVSVVFPDLLPLLQIDPIGIVS